MRHAYLTTIARGVEGGSQSYVLDAASGQPYFARQPREINVAGKRGFAWKSHLPDALSIFFIREGELNDEPQSPHERIVHTDKFDDPNLPGELTVTIGLKKVFCGTELNIVQEGIPDVIPPEACRLGWQESLALLAKLVEAEISD